MLYPAEEDLPSVFCLATPTGSRVRARLDAEDGTEPPAVRVGAVEYPVAALPGAQVRPLPDVIRTHVMPSPVADRLGQQLGAGGDDRRWHAVNRLAAWEALVARLEFGWPPDGWYPAAYYRGDLETRDRLELSVAEAPPDARAVLSGALTGIDDSFRRLTHDDGGASRRRRRRARGRVRCRCRRRGHARRPVVVAPRPPPPALGPATRTLTR